MAALFEAEIILESWRYVDNSINSKVISTFFGVFVVDFKNENDVV